jgi:hypothetical protein
MSNSVNYIGSHTINISDRFFFDANIWIFLYQPLGNYKTSRASDYSNVFNEILKNNCEIYISSLILSEFFNRILRYEFNVLKSSDPTLDFKKDFKSTPQYQTIINNIINITKNQILNIAKCIDDKFNEIDINELLNSMDQLDFNDKYYIEICLNNNYILVTDDADFKNSPKPLNIITANRKLT